MATISTPHLVACRRGLERSGNPINYNKTQINAAIQAIEDRFEATRSGFNTAIEGAAPGIFSAAQKRQLFAYWASIKFEIERA